MPKRDKYPAFHALDPFFEIIQEGLAGLVALGVRRQHQASLGGRVDRASLRGPSCRDHRVRGARQDRRNGRAV
jgi:hypothetical protein